MTKAGWLILVIEATAIGAAGAAQAPPRILEVRPSGADAGRFEAFELTLRLDAQFANPYDPEDIDVAADFTDPDGQTKSIAGFLYQEYDRALDDGKEKLTPRGERLWKVRYAPLAVGPHRYQVRVATRGGSAQGEPGSFACKPSKSPGFVRVSARNPRYFEFSDGQPFFPIGHNVCWADSQLKTYDYDQYFRKMAANTENFTRIWMCSWSLELEGPRLDDYRLDNAWRLDHVLRFAHTYGIYSKLCFDNFYDFTQKRHGPYWQANGGMCRDPRCFFTHPDARTHYLRRLRYIAARWGAYDEVMAWEFWNEMDYAPSDKGRVLSRKEPYMLTWTADMATALRKLDPFAHLITNSLAAYTDWPAFWALPGLDFVQPHAYIYEDWEPTPKQYDSADLVVDIAQDFEQYRKPYLIAELGFQPSGGTNRLNQLDAQGIHLHNALWASALSGAAGAPMLWWWDNYVDTNDLYYHYRALGQFLAGVDWIGQPWQPLHDDGRTSLRMVGLRTDRRALLWYHDRRNSWHRRLREKQPPQLLDRFTTRLPGLRPGRYRVAWFDTYTGGMVTTSEADADATGLLLQLSHLVKAPDVACKVTPLAEGAPGSVAR